MIEALQSNDFIPELNNRGLINFVSRATVPPEVAHDLLNARIMGEQDFETAVKYYFLKTPSIKFQNKREGCLHFQKYHKEKAKTVTGFTGTKVSNTLHQKNYSLGKATSTQCGLHRDAVYNLGPL